VYLGDIVEDMFANESKFSVHGRSSTALEIPCFGSVMREGRICVLEVGNKDKPMVNPEIRNDIESQNSRKSPLFGREVK